MRWALALMLGLQVLTPTAAIAQSSTTAPSQNPLLSQGSVVPPNMMVTLDTSWSMIYPYIPEGDVKLPGGTAKFPGFTSVIIHPDDNRYTVDQGRAKGDGGAIPGDPTSNASVFQMQMRSPDVNGLYYNPAVTYKPWLKSKDLSKTPAVEDRYSNATFNQVLFNPDVPANTLRDAKTPPNYADLSLVETARTAVWCNNPPAISGDKLTCTSSSKPFNPGLYYRLDGTAAGCPIVNGAPNPNDARCYTKYDINSGGPFPNYSTRTDCTKGASTCTQAQEQQNFANWFVYYRARLLMAQAALPETFLQLKDNKMRTGWATIHQASSKIDGIDTSNVVSGVRTMNTTRKQQLVEWIRAFKSDNTVKDSTPDPVLHSKTPLLTAMAGVGDYFSRTDGHGPWANDPDIGDSSPTAALSCRRSFNILITDGYYTDGILDTQHNIDTRPRTYVSGSGVLIGNDDGTKANTAITGPNNQSFTYSAPLPYADKMSGTLADVAMHYWVNDLFPDMPNNVPAGRDVITQDPAFWQHLVQFAIGLGVTGNIAADTQQATNAQLKLVASGTKGWWDSTDVANNNAPVSSNDHLADDLLHATVNSRGQYFKVSNPVALTTALTTALSRANRQTGLKQAGLALQSINTGGTNVKYVPEYTTVSWTGDVKAYDADASGNFSTKYAWSANEQLPAPADRNIATWNGSKGASFNWDGATGIGAANQALIQLPSGATGPKLIDYIRGDTSNEDNGVSMGLFRQRDSLIADIVDSTPTLLQGNVNLRYDLLATGTPGQSTYNDFVARKSARPPLLVAGDNGGVLHFFADYDATASTPNKSKNRGQEVFAYVPQAALSGLGNFASRDYGTDSNPHHFAVDGPLTESDAYFNEDWQNVLIGTMGAGGRAIFALNVTSGIPTAKTPPPTLGPDSVIWERSNVDDADFGYMVGDAQVGVLPNGHWTVFVGNGPYSDKGHAVLMLIDLSTGVITKVDASAQADSGNGLGAVQLVKNSNQQVVTIYAGDLKGNLWRFDVNPSDPNSSISVGLGGQPLFAGSSAQPITAAPAVVSHPKGGNMVVFGTGKLFDDTDPSDTTTQTLYGVWDAPTGTPSGLATSKITRGNLIEQKIITTPVTTNSANQAFFDIQFSNVDYKANNGWFMDLTLHAGQRLIYPITAIRDFVLINTVAPATPSDAPSCEATNGIGYLFLLPAVMDGRYAKTQVWDTNGDGVVDKNDVVAYGFSTPDVGRHLVSFPKKGGGGPGGPGPKPQCVQQPFDATGATKRNGGILPSTVCKIGSRIWRQLLNHP